MIPPKKSEKVPMAGGQTLGQNPFAALSGLNLPNAPITSTSATGDGQPAGKTVAAVPEKNRGRVDVLREKAGRGGKTVTAAAGFTGIGLPEKEQLAKKMQKACGVGGTVKDGRIEIQGDKRDEVARILTEAGFRPVFSGG
jgi:translation initiation factor 1